MGRYSYPFACSLLCLAAACAPSEDGGVDSSLPDGAVQDSAVQDASMLDATSLDASVPDAEMLDASTPDTGPIDAGPQPCTPNPCENGTCTPNGMDFSCECQPGWQGITCATETALTTYIVVTDTSTVVDAGRCAITPQSQVNEIELDDLCPDGMGGVLGPCEAPGITLAEAICAANNHPGPNTIVLGPELYTMTTVDNDWFGANALPPITSEITIIGNGAQITRAEFAPEFRFFWVPGATTQAATGGAVRAGQLTLERLTLRGGMLRGGHGGNAGPTSNPAGAGGGGGGAAGMGGAIFNEGTTTLRDVLLVDNAAIGGNGGRTSDVLGDPSVPAQATGGGGGSLRGDGGNGAETTAGMGAPGGGGNGGVAGATGFNGSFGGGGGGAGFDAFLPGQAGFGGGDGSLNAGGAGGRGLGGAVFNYLGLLRVENTTFAENRAVTGCHGDQVKMNGRCATPPPAWASAAGVYNLNGAVVLRGVTFARNEPLGIDVTGAIDFETIGDVSGGGVSATQPAMVDLSWTVFASASDGLVSFLSRNSSLAGMGSVGRTANTPSGTPLAGIMALRNFVVSQLRDRGGLTHSVLVGLPPAAEACLGLDGAPLLTDQRGQGRALTCIPGAYEDTSACTASDACAGECLSGVCAAPPPCPGPRCALSCLVANPCVNGGACSVRGCDCPGPDMGPTCAVDPSCVEQPALGVGQTCAQAVLLPNLPDSITSTIVVGTLAPGSNRTIWYRVRAIDQPDTNCDNFHFRASILQGGAAYSLRARRGDCADGGDAFSALGRFQSNRTNYIWANDFRGTIEGEIRGQCPCDPPSRPPRPDIDRCSDDSRDFFIGVTRDDPDAAGTCAAYSIEFSNGVYDTSP